MNRSTPVTGHFALIVAICLSLITATIGAGVLQDRTDVCRDLDRLLEQREYNGAVLAAKNGAVVCRSARGFADPDGKLALTTRSSFNLASVSKQFTAAAVMILVEEGKLQLDDPVADHLPELACFPGVTTRHLLNHTSGLPDIYAILERDWDKAKIAGNEQMLEIFATRRPKALFKPNAKFQYSNTGYIALASIVEKVSQLPFHRFLEERIFAPLEMKDSFAYYLTMKDYPRPDRVYGMRWDNGSWRLNDLIYCDGMRGDGNVHSSVEDLFKWDRALYGEGILKRETVRQMLTSGRLNDGTPLEYGFGFGVHENGRVVSHGGSWVGFRSLIVRYVDRGDTLIMLINGPSPKAKGMDAALKKLFFD